MRRRQPEPAAVDTVAHRLSHYRADDWGGGPGAPARWYAARQQWADEHDDQLMPMHAAMAPDAPFDEAAL